MLWLWGRQIGSSELNTTRSYTEIGDGEVARQDGWKMQDGRYLQAALIHFHKQVAGVGLVVCSNAPIRIWAPHR
jgi:hypothetical protein